MKLKKRVYVIFIVLILMIIIYHIPHNYTRKYKVKGYSIIEKYDKKLKLHYLNVNKNHKDYEFVVTSSGKKIVKDIDYYQKDDTSCLSITLKKEKIRPICYHKNTLKDISLINNPDVDKHFKIKNTTKDIGETYNNLTIHNLDNANFIIWNYKGFYYLKENIKDSINITDRDVYNLKVITRLDNLLLLADYQEEYNFHKFIIINLENGSKDDWTIDDDISMDSYILGTYDKSIYLVDKKNKIEYEIVPSHKKIRIVGTSKKDGVIYQDKFQNISLQKLINKEYSFSKNIGYNYFIESKKLYLKMSDSPNKIVVSTMDDLKIMDQNKDKVYFLSKDKLYVYSPLSGIKLLLENFEWNFNYENMIFVYNK